MLTADRQATGTQEPSATSVIAVGTKTSAAAIASCPEDCHYCSGPETD